MIQKLSYTIADFSPHLFWDVDIAKLEMDKNMRLLAERVIQRGNRDDLDKLLSHYGKKEVAEILKQLPWMNEKDMAFVHVFFDIPYNEMKCYTKRQSGLNF